MNSSHFKRAVARVRTMLWATDKGTATTFRIGYITALDDVERTGLRPMTAETKRRAADRAFKRLTDDA